MATKLPIREYTWVLDYCNRRKITPSALIKELLLDEIGPSPSHLAGRNIISYDKKKDSFVWSVELDDGEKVVVMENLSVDFLNDLNHGIPDALVSREEIIKRGRKGSVAVTKKMVRGRR